MLRGEPPKSRTSGIATAQAQRDLERRGLPRAVRTEQRNDLFRPHGKRKPVEGMNLAIRFDHVFKRENHDVAFKSDCNSAT